MDYYEVLEIPTNATEDEIKAAYKKMALKWHPDRHMADKERANQRFIEIHNAYKALTRKRERRRAQQSKSTERTTAHHDTSCPRTSNNSFPTHASHASRRRSPKTSSSSPPMSSSTSRTHCAPRMSHSQSAECHSNSRPFNRHVPTPHSNEYTTDSSSSTSRCSFAASAESGHSSNPSASATTPPVSPKSDKAFPTRRRTPQRPNLHKPTIAKLRKRSKARNEQKASSSTRRKNEPVVDQDNSSTDSEEFVFVPSFGKDETDKEVIKFSIQFTLEELFHGAHHRYRLKRHFRSGKKKNIVFEVDIPPGCRPGSKVLFRGVGNERKNGTLQDVVFVIEETPHQYFRRESDDLLIDIKLPWMKSLQDHVVLEGVDGRSLKMVLDYGIDNALKGSHVFRGAGMPVRRNGEIVGRGNLTVKWEIVPPPNSKWESLKKVLHINT